MRQPLGFNKCGGGPDNTCANPMVVRTCSGQSCSTEVTCRTSQIDALCPPCHSGNTFKPCVDCARKVRKNELVQGSCSACETVERTCAQCGDTFPKYKDATRMITLHEGHVCPQDIVSCKNCLETIQRREVENHCTDDTPITMKILKRMLAVRDNAIDTRAVEMLELEERVDSLQEKLDAAEVTIASLLRKVRRRKMRYGFKSVLVRHGSGYPSDESDSEYENVKVRLEDSSDE